MRFNVKHLFSSAIALVAMGSMAYAVPLTYELRATQAGSTATVSADGKSVTGSVGDTVKLELWAMIENTDGNGTNDAFKLGHGSFLSNGAGKVDLGGVQNLAPWNTGTAAPGVQADLDGDGDLEIGALDGNAAADKYFQAVDSRLADAQFGTGNGPTTNFMIATLVATLKGDGAADINFAPRNKTTGAQSSKLNHQFIQDGVAKQLAGVPANVGVGAAIHAQVGVVPEPSTMLLLAAGMAGMAIVARRRQG